MTSAAPASDISLWTRFRHTRSNPVRLVSDMSRLKRGPGQLGTDDYFRYRLWDHSNPSSAAAETFLGTALYRRVATRTLALYIDLARNPENIHRLLRSYDLPCPDTSDAAADPLRIAYTPHPKITAIAGPAPGLFRVLCVLEDRQSIDVFQARWLMPTGDDGEYVTAHIDPQSGTIGRAVKQTMFDFDLIDPHPDTGATLVGTAVPAWDQLVATVRTAAAIMPDCTVQAWDVLATAVGPVLLRLLPAGGDPVIMQLGAQTGLLTGSFARFLTDSIARQKQGRGKSLSTLRDTLATHASNIKEYGKTEAADQLSAEAPQQDEEFKLDRDMKSDGHFAKQLKLAVDQYGADQMTILSDIAKLTRKPTRLPPNEYFLYRLWDESRFAADAKRTFIGTGQWLSLHKSLANPWTRFAEDKLITNAILRHNGFSVTETQAIYHTIRHFPGAEQLRDRQAVAEFLRHRARYPMFGKPVSSQLSIGTASLESYLDSSDEILMADGSKIAVDAFVDQISPGSDQPSSGGSELLQLGDGYLFQSRLVPHPALKDIVGHRTGSVRMVYICDTGEPELIRASWKIPTGRNVADNYWREGNLLAGLDLDTGAIHHLVSSGPLGYENVEHLPGSAGAGVGMQFPEWPAMLETAKAACRIMPGCIFQGWDMALCDTGPVPIELQAEGGNPVLAQLGYYAGILSERYNQAIAKAEAAAKARAEIRWS